MSGHSLHIRHAGIIGAGAWGTALAQSLHQAGLGVTLWARDAALAEAINRAHINETYLPDVALTPAIRATHELSDFSAADIVLVVTPSQVVSEILTQAAQFLKPDVPIVICSKGIEQDSGRLMTDVVRAIMPEAPLAVLSGPSFAVEVARNLPVALTFACTDEVRGRAMMAAIAHKTFRLYWSDDVVGAQMGGSVKNVLAIAAGIVVGRRLGANAHAAMTTRGFAELARFGVRLGARFETLTGLSGLGDLILTCSSPQSRNMSLGLALGQGRALAEILAERKSITEGVYSVHSVMSLAVKHDVDMPICQAVQAVITGQASVDEAIDAILSRPIRAEAG